MQFKGKQGKLAMAEYESDSLISVENELGQSVATISTRNAFWDESKMYGKLFSKAPEMFEKLNEARIQLAQLRRSVTAHPDCTEGSEFDDFTTSAQEIENEIEELLSKISNV